jgi:hypothetical protein
MIHGTGKLIKRDEVLGQKLSKLGDAIRGLYFRRSKQLDLEQAIARIESKQMNLENALTSISGAQKNSEQATARIDSEIARIWELACRWTASQASSVEDALDKSISPHAPALYSAPDRGKAFYGWYEGMDFSEDWTSINFNVWSQIFDLHGHTFKDGLEIGSFEGRSAVFFLQYFPNLHLTCVDLFKYTDEFFSDRKSWATEFTGGVRFDKNLSKYKGRYDKVVASSTSTLSTFIDDKKQFDLIYIDGSHYRDDVFTDALLSWKLLRVNGIIIFDDYVWNWEASPKDRPKDAIEYFIYSHLDELKILHRGTQFIIKKIV